MAGNDNAFCTASSKASQVFLDTEDGVTYYVLVSGASMGEAGAFKMNITAVDNSCDAAVTLAGADT